MLTTFQSRGSTRTQTKNDNNNNKGTVNSCFQIISFSTDDEPKRKMKLQKKREKMDYVE